jgi:3'-5' exoribonuclease
VLCDSRFCESPGGSEEHPHNKYAGGLAIHTAEVMRNVFFMTGFPSDELITAVIWHDYMKIRDYEIAEDGKVVKTQYQINIRHVAGSAMEFHHQAVDYLPLKTLEKIEHLILSHHGRMEWGSPVEPKTAEAFILHAADMMSAKGCNL